MPSLQKRGTGKSPSCDMFFIVLPEIGRVRAGRTPRVPKKDPGNALAMTSGESGVLYSRKLDPTAISPRENNQGVYVSR